MAFKVLSFKTILVCLLLSIVLCQIDPDVCQTKTQFLQTHVAFPKELTRSLQYFNAVNLYSGKQFFDYGDYYNCMKFEGKTKFFIMYYRIQPSDPDAKPTTVNFGVCYFIECDEDTMNQMKYTWIKIYNKINKNKINPDDITFSDVDVQEKTQREKHFGGAIATLSVIGLVIILYFLNVILVRKKKEKKNEVIPEGVNALKKDERVETKISNDQEKVLDPKEVHNAVEKHEPVAEKPKKRRAPIYIAILKNFNVLEHLNKIFTVKAKKDEPLRIFDGIRFFSSGWVVFGHSYFVLLQYQPRNFGDISNIGRTLWGGIIYSAFFSVDIFFYMAAFMLYLSMQKYMREPEKVKKETDENLEMATENNAAIRKTDHKKKDNKPIKRFSLLGIGILGRYIRLFPLYAFCVFGISALLPFLISGSMNGPGNKMNDNCPNVFWENLLYVNNLFEDGATCAGHCWYLANDMQFFILFFIIFLFLNDKKLIRNLSLISIMLVSIVVSLYTAIDKDYNFNDSNHNRPRQGNFFNDYYIKPWIRVAPYILGLYFCEFYLESRANPKYVENQDSSKDSIIRKINRKIENSSYLHYIIIFISLILINFACFMTTVVNNYDVNLRFQEVMLSMNKILFVLGTGMIVHLTFLGKFKIIYNILSFDFFNVMAKLTFGIYIVHMYIYYWIMSNGIVTLYFSGFYNCILAIGVFTIATVFSVIMSLLFESPIVSLLKGIIG